MSIKAPLFKATLTHGDRSSPERLKYVVAITGGDDGEESNTSHDLVVIIRYQLKMVMLSERMMRTSLST